MQGIYNYVSEVKYYLRVYKVAANLWLQFAAYVIHLPMKKQSVLFQHDYYFKFFPPISY